MTITELQIQFDLNPDNRVNILNNIDNNNDPCRSIRYGYLFVDQEDGQCYLFDDDGQEDNISKVKDIDNWTFESCKSLTRIKIPSSVESLGNGVFFNCKFLTSVTILNSIKNIGNWAFDGCTSLKEVVFKRKTIDQIKAMERYPWGIKDESIIKVES